MRQGRVANSAFVNAIEPGRPVPLDVRPQGAQRLRFRAGPGLYQLSAFLDGRGFDWESLYENLRMFGNKGQRTGPWDFKLGPFTPLLPAYRVSLDGRPLGLWLMQRPSVEDLERRVFRGRTAFFVKEDGEHELALEPYKPADVKWVAARLEVDPDDRLAPLPPGLRIAPGNVPAAQWATPAFWEAQRRRLETTHRAYAEPLRLVFEWALAHGPVEDRRYHPLLDGPVLVVASRLAGDEGALGRALQTVDEAVAMEHWGNQNPDGYGHDGDMGAALTMRAMAWALHMLGDQLGEERRRKLLDKLALQGDRFFDLALLTRDYWGGSLLQDHGWRSAFAFGTAAMHLYGILPEAERWLMYAMPRVQRSLNAMPADGALPLATHHDPWNYLFDPAQYRETLLALGGPDIYDAAPFAPVVRYLALTCSPRDHRGEPAPARAARLMGPSVFLNQMAQRGDVQAAWLAEQMLECADLNALQKAMDDPAFYSRANHLAAHGLLWGFMTSDPDAADPRQAKDPPENPRSMSVPPMPPCQKREDYLPGATATGGTPVLREGSAASPVLKTPPKRSLLHFDDSAAVLFDDRESGASFSLRCGPRSGYRAYRNAPDSMDRMGTAPVAGHFDLSVGGVPLLVLAPPGYRLNTFLGNVLLVDGKGQVDDIGYAMSIPAWRDHGAEIRTARWDEATQTGFVRLDLEPAYPKELGVALYHRDFVFDAGRRIVLRDHVALVGPRTLSWLFHAREATGLACEGGLRYRLGKEPCLRLEPGKTGLALSATEGETDIVYGYQPSKPKFRQVRYDTTEPVSAATADFVIEW